MSATEQLRRLLALVPYLQGHDGARVEDVATAFGVSERQILKDLNVIYWCGLPGLAYGDLIEIDMEAVKGKGVIHLSNAGFLARPLRFTLDEVAALTVAVRALRDVAGPRERQAIDATLDKLTTAAGEYARAAGQAEVRVGSASDQIRDAVDVALAEKRQLHLTYDVASRAETTRRVVDPLRLRLTDGFVYLDAWCHLAGGLRYFRLDRMAAAELLDTPSQEHDVELPDAGQGWFESGAPTVTLDLGREAQWIAEYYPVQGEPEAIDDQTLRVTLPVGDPAWLRTLLLRLGGGAVVVGPATGAQPGAGALARAAAAAATEALEQYAALFPEGPSPEHVPTLAPEGGGLP